MWEDAAVELRGSKTEANLITAFSGESQATNKYTYYASKAKSEGYGQIGAIFEETAGIMNRPLVVEEKRLNFEKHEERDGKDTED